MFFVQTVVSNIKPDITSGRWLFKYFIALPLESATRGIKL